MSALKTRVMLFIIAICFTIGVIGIGKGLSSKNSDRHTATAQAKVVIEEVSDSQTGKISGPEFFAENDAEIHFTLISPELTKEAEASDEVKVLSDDELIEYMVKVFNGRAQGSAEYLSGTSLEALAKRPLG